MLVILLDLLPVIQAEGDINCLKFTKIKIKFFPAEFTFLLSLHSVEHMLIDSLRRH